MTVPIPNPDIPNTHASSIEESWEKGSYSRSALLVYGEEKAVEGMSSGQLGRLRELRLWHWRQFLMMRESQKISMRNRDFGGENVYKANAHIHLGFVQSLNDFFPIGDTAEKDAAT